jgi:hypothetical protein
MNITRLQAVRFIMADASGDGAVTALDSTGSFPAKVYGTSNTARAESFLDRALMEVLQDGFASRLDLYVIAVPTVYYSYTGTDPSFTFGAELTDGGGAVVRFNYTDTSADRVYCSVKSGTPATGASTLGALTTTGSTTITTSRIAGSPLWLHAEAAEGETKSLEFRRETEGGTPFFFDRFPSVGGSADSNPLGSTFSADIRVQARPALDFGVLPFPVQDWIVKRATLSYAQVAKGPGADMQYHIMREQESKMKAMQSEMDKMGTNWHDTAHDRAMRGGRPDIASGEYYGTVPVQ